MIRIRIWESIILLVLIILISTLYIVTNIHYNSVISEGSHRVINGRDTLYVQVSKKDWPWKLKGVSYGEASVDQKARRKNSH